MKFIPNSVFKLFTALLLSQLAGCNTIDAVTQRPFNGDDQAIRIGVTTRSEIRALFGAPDDQDPVGNWEVYRAQSDGVRLALIVPFSEFRMWTHYLLVTYDATERVCDLGTGTEKTAVIGDTFGWGPTLYAGDYGYQTFAGRVFLSIDGGGEADSAWAIYLMAIQHYTSAHDNANFFAVDAEAYKDIGFALSDLCAAAKLEHPCALDELGGFFWRRPYGFLDNRADECRSGASPLWFGFARDDVKACVWYAMADGKVVPPWCRAVLSDDEMSKVRSLLVDWQPSKCERQLAPYIRG